MYTNFKIFSCTNFQQALHGLTIFTFLNFDIIRHTVIMKILSFLFFSKRTIQALFHCENECTLSAHVRASSLRNATCSFPPRKVQ